MPSFASGSTAATLLTPQEITADGNSPGIDITAYQGEIMVLLTGKSNAGTNPTMACKLQLLTLKTIAARCADLWVCHCTASA